MSGMQAGFDMTCQKGIAAFQNTKLDELTLGI